MARKTKLARPCRTAADTVVTEGAAMWLSEPIYESLPYYYMALGVIAGIASFRVQTGYWPEALAAVAVASLVTGLVLILKRRDYRRSRSRLDLDVDDQA